MCRVGGRRCPGEHDPAVREARNAKRRAKYAADKAAGKLPKKRKKSTKVESAVETVTPEVETPSIPVAPKPAPPKFNPAMMPKKKNPAIQSTNLNDEIEQAYNALSTTQEENPLDKLGLNSEKYELTGSKFDNYYQYKKITGTIDYTKLNEDSYKAFGFLEPKKDVPYRYSRSDDSYTAKTKGLSKNELKDATDRDITALTIFSGDNYEWINETVYDPYSIEDMPKTVEAGEPEELYGDEDLDMAAFPAEAIMRGDVEYFNENSYSQELFYKITDQMDKSLDRNAPRKQRMVYRGVSKDRLEGMSVDQWIDQQRSLGQEVVFTGYTSSSYDKASAGNFAYNDGIMYEILTTEGVAISSISDSEEEEEILLPRQQRYMVVGIHKDVLMDKQLGWRTNVIQMVAINDKGEILDGTNQDKIPSMRTSRY